MKVFKFSDFDVLSSEGVPKEKIQLLKVGKIQYGPDVIDADMPLFQELVKNFKNGVRGQRLPVELGHTDSGAMGWITNLFIEGDGLFALVEWTEIGLEKLKGKIFAYVSAEIYFNYIDSMDTTKTSHKAVLGGFTLTNRPHIKHITSAVQGFTELEDGEEEELEPLSDLANLLKAVNKKLKTHPELYRKKSSPLARNALSVAIENLQKFIKTKEVEISMTDTKNENIAVEEEEVKTEELEATPEAIEEEVVEEAVEEEKEEAEAVEDVEEAKQDMVLSEIAKFKEELQKSFDLKFSEYKKEVERQKLELEEAKKVTEQRVALAEKQVIDLKEKDEQRENLLFVDKLVTDGNILQRSKEKALRLLTNYGKTSSLTLSETEQFNHKEEFKEFLLDIMCIDLSQKGTDHVEQDQEIPTTKKELHAKIDQETKLYASEHNISYYDALDKIREKYGGVI